MAKFSVYVPARKGSDMPDLTLRVDASNWLVALRASLTQIGEQGDNLSNIVCETAQDGAIRVADPVSRRVFVIKKVTDEAVAAATEPSGEKARQEAEAAAREKAAREAELAAAERRAREHAAAEERRLQEEAIARAQREAAVREAERMAQVQAEQAAKEAQARAQEQARIAQMQAQAEAERLSREAQAKAQAERERLESARKELERLEAEKQRIQAELARATQDWDKAANKAAQETVGTAKYVEVVKGVKPDSDRLYDDLDDWYDQAEVHESTAEDVLADVFMSSYGLHEKNPVDAAGIVLDLLTKQLPCEASSIFLTDNNSALKDLVLVQARGPVSDKVVGVRLPLGRGIVGFSVLNLISMTVNDVHTNQNFYGAVDQEVGFRTRSILCVPVAHEGRAFGAIEAINKPQGKWTTQDLGLLESLAGILARAIYLRGMIQNV